MSGENYHLIIRKGPKPGQIYPLLAPSITIGRDPMSDIVLNDAEVSRYHAQLTQTETGYQIQDMGSTNGTYVAGERLSSAPADLTPGIEIAFGSGMTLTFEMTGGENEAAATFVESAQDLPTAQDAMADIPQTSAPPSSYNQPIESAPPLVPSADEEAARKKKRTISIIVAVILILILCCCGFTAFMWFYGGDWIISQLGQAALLPIINVFIA